MWLDTFGRTEEQDKEFFEGANLPTPKPQKKEPGLFDGTGDALLYTIPYGHFGLMGVVQELSAYKLSQMYETGLENNEDALSEPIKADKDKIIQRAENEAKYYRLKAKKEWTPNPETTGAAAQMIHGIGSTMLKALGYSVIAGGNPVFASAMFGTDMGVTEYGTLIDKGVDAETAKQAGWASGALNALGLAIPGSIGTNYLYSAGLGAVVNPASDVLEQGAIKYILENADYRKVAGEYDPFDITNLSVSSGMGVVFGLMGAKGARSRARRAEEFAKQDAELAKLQEEAKNAQESVGENKAQDSSRLNQEVLSSIQSRNLSTPESVKRTKEIAEKPDFNLVSESRVIEKGSPVIAFVETPNSKTIGKEVVVTDNNGNEMTMRYAVVEANSIHTSNDVEGKQNPDFVNPDVLGARAIEGNDSVVGLKSAYENNTAGQYREELLSQSKNFGISRGKIKNMHQPILVRMMKDEDVKAHISEPPKGSDTQKTVPAEQEVQGTEVDSTVSQGEAVLKKQITTDTVDAAMELNSARVITQDQPSGKNGNINKSLQDEAAAREQIDDGKKVEVTGEGVDPEVMDKNVSSFITRFVKELVGAGADKKVAGMNARVIDAFFSTMGVRLGKSRKEIEAEYELKVRNGEDPSKNSYAQEAGVPQVRPGLVRKPDQETAKVVVIKEDELPSFKDTRTLVKWLKEAFAEKRSATISSTNQHVVFTNTGLAASVKRTKEAHHDNVYPRLNEVVENAEYDSFEPHDKRHPNILGQDVYVSAIRIGGNLYRVKLKFDIPSENEILTKKKLGLPTDEVRYKDHKLSEIEIAQLREDGLPDAPEASAGFLGLPHKGAGTVTKSATDSVDRVSLGILRGNVNPSKLKNGVLYQSAYHGSPHKFDEFSTDFIGSGEGAQAHGWGLYFAKSKDVAQNYRRVLTAKKFLEEFENKYDLYDRQDWRDFAQALRDGDIELDPKYQKLWDAVEKENYMGYSDFRSGFLEYIRDPEAYGGPSKVIDDALKDYDGRLFELDIPETNTMLDEQLTFYKQPPEVQKAVWDLLVELEGEGARNIDLSKVTGRKLLKYLEDVAKYSGQEGAQKWAALQLNKHGIKGISYDGRRDGRCFVVFDDQAVKIMEYFQGDSQTKGVNKGIYTPGERVITLLQSADESTFVHESGHYFLDVLTDIGSRERVPKQIKDDIQTLMDWFGVKNLEEWNSLSFEEKRQYHEKFARGFEQYLREGKAPSSTLEKVFKSFKDWLMKIYKSAEELDVELSPEVRAVYDRLLATDEQIKQRKAELGGRAEGDMSTGQRGAQVPEQVTEAINNLPIPEEAKGVLKNTLGIEDTSGQQQATGEKHPHSGIPTEEEFIRQSLETDSVRDPDAFIVDENGNEVSLKDYLAEQDRIAEREIKDANAMGVAAECMWRQGAFDEI